MSNEITDTVKSCGQVGFYDKAASLLSSRADAVEREAYSRTWYDYFTLWITYPPRYMVLKSQAEGLRKQADRFREYRDTMSKECASASREKDSDPFLKYVEAKKEQYRAWLAKNGYKSGDFHRWGGR